jgi:lysyl-tRNA synthetase, class I
MNLKALRRAIEQVFFDDVLRLILVHYDEILSVMLPSLREERRKTYSPFLPICPRTGTVLQVPVVHRNLDDGTIAYRDEETGQLVEVPITGGHCKLQWKVDWAMRWRAFEVDYEMSGKDLIDSVKLSSQICRIIGGRAPENLTYELFLDERGEKISKSKGNGLTIDQWLSYAPPESLSYYMFQSPRRAKRLYFDIIPRCVDEYLGYLEKYPTQKPDQQVDGAVWHIHNGKPPVYESGLGYSILLNLASVCHSEDKSVLWGFVTRYSPGASPETMPYLDKMIGSALAYYRDFVKPYKEYRAPTEAERLSLLDLLRELQAVSRDATPEELQTIVFTVGKRHPYDDLRSWFGTLYEVLLGQKEGPRMGSFIALFGIDETINLIEEKLLF